MNHSLSLIKTNSIYVGDRYRSRQEKSGSRLYQYDAANSRLNTMESTCKRDRTVVGMHNLYSLQSIFFFLLLRPANGFLGFSTTTVGVPMSTKATISPRCDMVVATSAIDHSIPLTHQPGRDGNDERVPQRRSLRRKIPYVESFAEQVSRELWEKYPFLGAEHVVDAIIEPGSDILDQSADFQPILSPISLESEFPSPSGYEDSFDLIYKCSEDGNVYSHGGVSTNCNTDGIIDSVGPCDDTCDGTCDGASEYVSSL